MTNNVHEKTILPELLNPTLNNQEISSVNVGGADDTQKNATMQLPRMVPTPSNCRVGTPSPETLKVLNRSPATKCSMYQGVCGEP